MDFREKALGMGLDRRKAVVLFGVACFVAGSGMASSPASAQTFQSYHCADGTHFIVAFYPYDSRAHMQIDGRAATLAKRLALSGSRYSGEGVTLTMAREGVTVRRRYRPTTACEAM
jgi:membrane-bound inhibitor of C-type lysozyme